MVEPICTTHHGISQIAANEAVHDPAAVWCDPDPKSRSGESIRVIGYSESIGGVVVVILVRTEQPRRFWGATGFKANTRDRRIYDRDLGDQR